MSKLLNANIEHVIQTGNLAQLKEWVESGQKFSRKRYDLANGDNKTLLEAVKYGHFEMVKWLVDECGQKIIPTHPGLRDEILRHSPALRYLSASTRHDLCTPVPRWMNAVIEAVRHKHFEIAKWLLCQQNCVLPEAEIRSVLTEICNFEDLDLFKCFFSIATEHLNKYEILDEVAAVGTFEMIKWMTEESGQAFDLSWDNYAALNLTLYSSNFEAARWLISRLGNNLPDWKIKNILEDLIDLDLDFCKWFFIYALERIGRIGFDECGVFKRVVSYGGLEIIKWMIEHSGQVIDCRDCESWNRFGFIFKDWDEEEYKKYLLSVKQQQEVLGLEKWAEVIKVKNALNSKETKRF